MATWVDPLLHWKVQKEITMSGAERFATALGWYFENGYQGGFMAGQEPVADLVKRWSTLALEYQRNKAVAEDPTVFPGDAQRAQEAIREETQLRQELFGATQ